MRTVVVLCAVLLAAACGESPSSRGDAGLDAPISDGDRDRGSKETAIPDGESADGAHDASRRFSAEPAMISSWA